MHGVKQLVSSGVHVLSLCILFFLVAYHLVNTVLFVVLLLTYRKGGRTERGTFCHGEVLTDHAFCVFAWKYRMMELQQCVILLC